MNQHFNWVDETDAVTAEEMCIPDPQTKDGTYTLYWIDTDELAFVYTVKNGKVVSWLDLLDKPLEKK